MGTQNIRDTQVHIIGTNGRENGLGGTFRVLSSERVITVTVILIGTNIVTNVIDTTVI